MSDGDDARDSPQKRPLWIAVAALLCGAAALWGSSGLTWIEVPEGRTVGGRIAEDLTGSDVATWHVPLALLALAAVAATLALRGLARRVLGVLLVAVGVWTGFLALDGSVYDIAWSGWAPGYEGGGDEPQYTVAGPATTVAGGALIVLAGIVLAWRGHRMPRMGAKYAAPGAERTTSDPDTELWDALSEGEDPTARGE